MDTLAALCVSFLWIICLKNFAALVVYSLLVGAPTVMFSFGLYPLVMSYRGKWEGRSFQDKAMRSISVVPFVLAVLWIWVIYRSRRSMEKAVQIIRLASRVLASNKHLIFLSYATLVSVTLFSWMWIAMFSRVFLSGNKGMVAGKFVL